MGDVGINSTPGGVTIFWREAKGWGVEGVWSFGPNVFSFIITSGQKRWYGVGTYVPPNNLLMINLISQVLECEPNEDKETDCWRPQRLPVKSEGPKKN